MSDNIIKFPHGKEEEEQKEDQAKLMLDNIHKNRASGLQALDSALGHLDATKGVADEPNVEARLRFLESAVRGLGNTTQALDQMSGILENDIVATIMNLERVMAASTLYGMHLQTLIDTLVTKELVTKEDLEATWIELNKQREEAQGA